MLSFRIIFNEKQKNKKYHTVETVLKSNEKILESGKIDAPSTLLHDRTPFWIGTDTSIKCFGVKPPLFV